MLDHASALVTFSGSGGGDWIVEDIRAVVGAPLPPTERLSIETGPVLHLAQCAWSLRGVISHLRYTTRDEAALLGALQPPLGRPEATRGALIPITKSTTWWDLPQDERRAIYEERSRHTSIGLDYLPRIARRLHHSRELGEPFDFLTWFEFAPEHEDAFDDLVARLRGSEEWRYVEREVDMRLSRAG